MLESLRKWFASAGVEAVERQENREIYLDVETLRLSHEVAGGWSNIRSFGLAVAVTWDERNGFRDWYEPQAKSLLSELENYTQIITFNGERFDFAVLSAYGPVDHLYDHSLDLLKDTTARLGGKRVKLDYLVGDTLGIRKTGNGTDAVAWWRAGDKKKVTDYCRNDVAVMVKLVKHARETGYVVAYSRRLSVNWGLSSRPRARVAKTGV